MAARPALSLLPLLAATLAAFAAAVSAAPPPPAADEIVAHRVLLTEAAKSGAVALDGSPPMFYITNASSAASRAKWHVYLEGGGWCESTASCAKRANSTLGSSSSAFHDATLSLPSGCRCDGGGYFSSNASRNPLMHDWNQVFVNYLGTLPPPLPSPHRPPREARSPHPLRIQTAAASPATSPSPTSPAGRRSTTGGG